MITDKIIMGKPYHKPVLSRYSDLRTVTLGSSPIGSESGPGGEDFRVPPGSGAPESYGQGETEDIFE